MKVVHMCLQGYVEGSGYQESILARWHKKMGMDVYVLAASNDKNRTRPLKEQRYINGDGVKITILAKRESNAPRFWQIRFMRWTKGVYERLKEIKPDILFIHGGETLDTFEMIKYIRHYPQMKVYADCHSDYYNAPVSNTIKGRFLIWWKGIPVRQLAKYVYTYWGVTPWRVEYLEKVYRIPREKLGLLVMGGDDTYIHLKEKYEIRRSIRLQYDISETDFVIFSGGNIDKEKKIHELTKAVANSIGVKLLIVGSPVENYINEFESFTRSNHNVKFVGWVESTKVYDYLLASDIAVFPGTHSVLWEQAVACGVPIVVKRWPGMQHIDLGGNCIFLDYSSSDEIAEKLYFIENNKEKFNSMKCVAIKRGIKQFCYSNIAKKAIGLL